VKVREGARIIKKKVNGKKGGIDEEGKIDEETLYDSVQEELRGNAHSIRRVQKRAAKLLKHKPEDFPEQVKEVVEELRLLLKQMRKQAKAISAKYVTSNRAFVLRPSITDWIMKALHRNAEKKGKRIGIVLGRESEPQRALQPDGKRFTCRVANAMKRCEEVAVFREWDTELDLSLCLGMIHASPLSTAELETLARNISQLDRLQRLKLAMMKCANLRGSFVQSLQIQSLQSLTYLSLHLRDQKGLTADDYVVLCEKITSSTSLSHVELHVDNTSIDNQSLEMLVQRVGLMKRLTYFSIAAPGTVVGVGKMEAL